MYVAGWLSPKRASRSIHWTVAILMVTGVAAGCGMLASPAGAATPPVSQASGHFLSGTVGGKSLDQVAAIQGEQAQNNGGTATTNFNSLDSSAINNSLKPPLTNALQVPGGNAMHFGAVNQYATARPDGSALGASGAVNNSGGVGAGGQNGTPPSDATFDLSGLGGAGVANTLGNLKLKLGAVSAQSSQTAGANRTQTGHYQIAGLGLDLTSPALAQLINPLIDQVTTQVAGLAPAINSLGVVKVTGLEKLPDAAKALTTLKLLNGSIVASLQTGSIHVDLAALLSAVGLDLNNLPPNTDLMPYLIQALSQDAPQALVGLLNSLQGNLTSALDTLGVEVLGLKLDSGQAAPVTKLLTDLQNKLTPVLNNAATQASTLFKPLVAALQPLLGVVVNGQSTSDGIFTERAVQLKLGNGPAAATINLASAAVGSGRQLVPTPNPTSPASPGTFGPRSTIKIDSGRGATDGGGSFGPMAGLGAALLLVGVTGAAILRRRASGNHS